MQIDVRGEICPYPVKKTLEALERLPAGEELEILTDHPPSLEMIRFVASQRGFAVRVTETGPGDWRIVLTRREGMPT